MFHDRVRLALSSLAILVSGLSGEEKASIQSPRQAIIEMLSGGETGFKKHLTVEMQNRLQDLMKPSPNGAPNPLQAMIHSKSSPEDNFQAFDLGPILFSFNSPQQHERYEVQIESDELRGAADVMGLSLHLVSNGVEQDSPVVIRFVLSLKRQQDVWRLEAVTLSATLPVGDPRILDRFWWNPAGLNATTGAADNSAASPVVEDERPKMTPLRAVRMIGLAENLYAQGHPGIGYTCNLSDLVNIGKGMDDDGVYRFIDPDFAKGVYNGYRFALSGCERRPASVFHVVAEPVVGHGKAYCNDNANNIRASEDGRGLTCLTSGKLAHK